MPTQIISPLLVEKVIQEEGTKQAEMQWRAGSELPDDLPRRLVLLMGVGPDEVEVELIGGGLGEELRPIAKRFRVEELVLDEAVNGLHVALVGVSGGRDADMLAVAQGSGESGAMAVGVVAADELRAIVPAE